jgi:ComF family protein
VTRPPAHLAALPRLRRFFERAASLLAPDVCTGCDARLPPFRVFCPACAATLLPPRAVREGEIAAFAYGGALAGAIASLKYAGRVDRARPLSALLRRAVLGWEGAFPSVVVPVPLHRDRLARRGFNQAALLARPVAGDLGARFASRALVRIHDTPAQASLDRAARRENVARAFAVRLGVTLEGARVLLVDDVRTTGATLDACARVAREAGASDVRTLVLAVADD